MVFSCFEVDAARDLARPGLLSTDLVRNRHFFGAVAEGELKELRVRRPDRPTSPLF